jgi:hypothetical protein
MVEDTLATFKATFPTALVAAVAAMLSSAQPGLAEAGQHNCVHARGIWSCSDTWNPEEKGGGFPKVIHPPAPSGDRETAEADEHYRKWLDRCRPVVKDDKYGVGRYTYAAAGCEFGRIRD